MKTITKLLGEPEGLHLEFKQKINDGVYKTVAAFANTDGGSILVGVTDKGQIAGINVATPEMDQLTSRMIDKLGIHPRINTVTYKGKDLIHISVEAGNAPVTFEGRYYKRVGATTREMTSDELDRFFRRRLYWDSQICEKATLKDIDASAVRLFVRMGIASGRLLDIAAKESAKTVLSRLKLIDGEKVTNAAVMLFGKDPQKYYFNAVVRVGRFKREDLIIGDRRIEGNLFTQVDEAEEAIKNFMNVRYDITGESMIRKNVWDYPVEAVREMLNNAVVHRDYFSHGTQTQIKIFDDHIRAFNPGNLMDDLTIEKLQGPHVSIARNPLLAHIFYLAGRIEQYGSGMDRIRNALAAQGQPPQTIETLGYGFVLIMKEPAAGGQTEVVKRLGKRLGEKLGETERRIMDILSKDNHATITSIARSLEISTTAVEKQLAKLKRQKLLKRIGPAKGGRWEVVG